MQISEFFVWFFLINDMNQMWFQHYVIDAHAEHLQPKSPSSAQHMSTNKMNYKTSIHSPVLFMCD